VDFFFHEILSAVVKTIEAIINFKKIPLMVAEGLRINFFIEMLEWAN
jgi:hypothetical protein